jgi:hypothetical protein
MKRHQRTPISSVSTVHDEVRETHREELYDRVGTVRVRDKFMHGAHCVDLSFPRLSMLLTSARPRPVPPFSTATIQSAIRNRGEVRRIMTIENLEKRPDAHPARVYDYFIGGENGLEADRAAGAWIQMQAPDLLTTMQENRAFLSRAVRRLVQQGVDQFIDIGSGFPVSPNTHETVLRESPSGSVVYCDVDPEVGRRTRELIAGQDGADFVRGDILNPGELLAQPAVQALIRSGRPVACVLGAVLHFVPESADPDRITAALRAALPRGSYLVVSHIAGDIPWGDHNDEETLKRAFEDMHPRTRAQIARFFGDFELVPPGVVPASQWHPAGETAEPHRASAIYGGVARKN